jgi:hypothetical protein
MTDPPGALPRLFICYRKDDTLAVADRLAVELRRALDGEIFIDHRSLDGGQPWPDRLRLSSLT